MDDQSIALVDEQGLVWLRLTKELERAAFSLTISPTEATIALPCDGTLPTSA